MKTTQDGPVIDEMNQLIEQAERKQTESAVAHGQLLAAFRRYLSGKALGKEDVGDVASPHPGEGQAPGTGWRRASVPKTKSARRHAASRLRPRHTATKPTGSRPAATKSNPRRTASSGSPAPFRSPVTV